MLSRPDGRAQTAMRFELEPHNRHVADDDLLDDLKAVARSLGTGTVTASQYNAAGRYHSATFARRFGSWLKALEAAGLRRSRNLHITDDQLFENLVDVWLGLGRQPRYSDIDGPASAYSAGTYANRFGGWRAALERFVEWANSEGPSANAIADRPRKPAKRTSRTINWRLRAMVLMRDGARCQLCGADVASGAKLHVDHIVPWSRGGETVLDNLQILCEVCNIGKGAETAPLV